MTSREIGKNENSFLSFSLNSEKSFLHFEKMLEYIKFPKNKSRALALNTTPHYILKIKSGGKTAPRFEQGATIVGENSFLSRNNERLDECNSFNSRQSATSVRGCQNFFSNFYNFYVILRHKFWNLSVEMQSFMIISWTWLFLSFINFTQCVCFWLCFLFLNGSTNFFPFCLFFGNNNKKRGDLFLRGQLLFHLLKFKWENIQASSVRCELLLFDTLDSSVYGGFGAHLFITLSTNF